MGLASHSVGIVEDVKEGSEVKQTVVAGSKVTVPSAATDTILWTKEYRFYMHRYFVVLQSPPMVAYVEHAGNVMF